MPVRRLFVPSPMHRSTGGFSLIELIAVMVLLGVISFAVLPRFASTEGAAVQSGRDQVLAAAHTAQQLAMARSSDDTTVELVLGAGSVSVEENGTPVTATGDSYPSALPDGVSITAGTGRYDYDKLGRITGAAPVTLTLARGGASATLRLEASGYAHVP